MCIYSGLMQIFREYFNKIALVAFALGFTCGQLYGQQRAYRRTFFLPIFVILHTQYGGEEEKEQIENVYTGTDGYCVIKVYNLREKNTYKLEQFKTSETQNMMYQNVKTTSIFNNLFHVFTSENKPVTVLSILYSRKRAQPSGF